MISSLISGRENCGAYIGAHHSRQARSADPRRAGNAAKQPASGMLGTENRAIFVKMSNNNG
jgi:hypothetical protein